MTKKNYERECLRRAVEADLKAAQTKDAQVKKTWERIADGYRDLAHNYDCRTDQGTLQNAKLRNPKQNRTNGGAAYNCVT